MWAPFATPISSPATLLAFNVALAVAGMVIDGVLLRGKTVGSGLPTTLGSLAAFTGARTCKVVVSVLALVAAAGGAQLITEAQLADNLTFTGARACRVVVSVLALVAAARGAQLTAEAQLADNLNFTGARACIVVVAVLALVARAEGAKLAYDLTSTDSLTGVLFVVSDVICRGVIVLAPIVGRSGGFVTTGASTEGAGATTVNVVEYGGTCCLDLVVGSSYILHRLHV